MTNINKNEKENTYETKGHLIPKLLLTIIILLVVALPILMIKFNVGEAGEKLRPIIGDLPYIQKVLPKKPDPDDPKYMTKEELSQAYLRHKEEYRQIIIENDNIKRELEQIQNVKDNYEQFLKDQEKLVQDKINLHSEIQDLEKDKTEFFKDIKDSNIDAYKKFYEKMDKEMANQLYQEIIQEDKADKRTKEYVAYYENMEAEDAAKVFNEMSKTQKALVVTILKYMNKESAAEILAAMNLNIASDIAIKLSEQYLE